MKTLRTLAAATAILALAAFAFTPPADARTPGHQRHGYGHHHHYRHGYRHHDRGPRVSVGFIAPILPFGHLSLAVGGRPYYYDSGYFYRPAPVGYVVVSAPLGASVATLPASAVQVEIGGAIYYQYANTYYQWHPANRAYVVVPAPATVTSTSPGYAPGAVVEVLPTGYTAEIVNGVQYYRYGSDYFLPTQRDGREVYVVVRI